MLITQGSLVRAQLDPPNFQCLVRGSRGISSAGRAPALQAGGRRFDPVILHHLKMIAPKGAIIVGSADVKHKRIGSKKPELQYKSSLKQTAFILRFISIGCSLKIHRVEISVAGGKS